MGSNCPPDPLCRLCLQCSESYIAIETEEGLSIATKAEKILQINLSYDADYYPKIFCTDCVARVIEFHEFKQQTQENCRQLAEMFHEEQQNVKVEVPQDDAMARPDPSQDVTDIIEVKFDEEQEQGQDVEEEEEFEQDEEKVEEDCIVELPESFSVLPPTPIPPKDPEKWLVCGFCEKEFSNEKVLAVHRSIEHYVEANDLTKPFECSLCRKRYAQKSYLAQHHYKAHVAPDLYLCPKCPKKAKTRKLLDQHLLNHHEKMHQCRYCPKAFKKPIVLRDHEAAHTGHPEHRCLFCQRMFNSSANRYSHMKRMHKVEWERVRHWKDIGTMEVV